MARTAEEWKPVVGYKGFYEVSNKKRVRSLDRTVKGVDGRTYHKKGVVLNAWHVRGSTYAVSLMKRGVRKTFATNTLVSKAFKVAA